LVRLGPVPENPLAAFARLADWPLPSNPRGECTMLVKGRDLISRHQCDCSACQRLMTLAPSVHNSAHVTSPNSGSTGKGDEYGLKRDFRPADLRQTGAETIAVEPARQAMRPQSVKLALRREPASIGAIGLRFEPCHFIIGDGHFHFAFPVTVQSVGTVGIVVRNHRHEHARA
jgi:hypothetical protein